ncbi:MAG: TolC family protein, partial [Thermoanaerobaculia bacterium]
MISNRYQAASLAAASLLLVAKTGPAQEVQPAAPAGGRPSVGITLAEGLAEAFARSPALAVARAELAAAEAGLRAARTYPWNPVLEVETAERSGPEVESTDRGASLTQEIEIAGQLGKRVAAGRADLAAAQGLYERQAT